ncbi:MAG: DUF4290 domain-containing protein [Phocaeicola sp.]
MLEYNTQQRTLPLPEYGRSVQNMVDHALTIEDRAERQRCAKTIINIMGGMFPHLRDVPDFKHKLWDHLAIMADFKLDIDYPYEIVKKESLGLKPNPLSYPQGAIRYRHYGRFLQQMIKKATEMEEGPARKQLTSMLGSQMKRSLQNWNKEGVEDQKVVADLSELSEGTIQLAPEDIRLRNEQASFNPRRQQRSNNNNNSNNQRRKSTN